MQHLKQITISNARRFGKDIQINLSPQANIFLAPNGTGKTTLFEAIEFALTGSIKRLGNPPLCMIRDRQSGVDVRLDFYDNKFCEVSYKKDEEVSMTGDHRLLFPKHTLEEVPYLLRLTHLLEQRGLEWFVQKAEKGEAGGLLDRLSIGKELSNIANTKSQTLNAATRTIGEANDKKLADLAKKDAFELKLRERDAARINYTLTPLENLIQHLKEIRAEDVVMNATVEQVTNYASKVSSFIERRKQELETNLLLVSAVSEKIGLYVQNAGFISQRQEVIIVKEKSLTPLSEEIVTATENVAKLNLSLGEQTRLLRSLEEAQKLVEKKKAEEAVLAVTVEQIKSAGDSLAAEQVKFQNVTEEINKLRQSKEVFDRLHEREKVIMLQQEELGSRDAVIDNWKQLVLKIDETTKALAANEKLIADKKRQVETIDQEQKVALKLLDDSNLRLRSLTDASEAISGAVSIIAANLPIDEGVCPVCTAEYPPDELKNRITKALVSIDPVLQKEGDINREAKLNAQKALQAVEIANRELLHLLDTETNLKAIAANAEQQINDQYIARFPGCKDAAAAEGWLADAKATNQQEIEKLDNEKKALGTEPLNEDINVKVASRDQSGNEIQYIERKLVSLKTLSDNKQAEIKGIEEKLDKVDLFTLETDVSVVSKEIEKLKILLSEASMQLQLKDKDRKKVESEIADLRMMIAQLQGQQATILLDWKNAGLAGEPVADTVKSKLADINRQQESNNKHIANLNSVQEELATWTAAEKFLSLQNEIQILCAGRSEEDHLLLLQEQAKKSADELAFVTERKKALQYVYGRVTSEINSVHQKIQSINPLWISHLKRVVVNQRFVETSLKTQSYRNKTQAEVLTTLHDEPVNVINVASEAQATDLQLTFMLSMASKYTWTPWRSLLLDDPTQHHDLVHASGVFDLLRDYVADHSFQVLMGTHDSVHAKFFQRKLQNDNIDVRLWNLVATNEGVKAEEMS